MLCIVNASCESISNILYLDLMLTFHCLFVKYFFHNKKERGYGIVDKNHSFSYNDINSFREEINKMTEILYLRAFYGG